jgi:gliding motility-associated-like protein
MRFYFRIKQILIFCLAILFVQGSKLMSQTTYQLPPNQPEQDACNAIQLCGSFFNTPYSYTGHGKTLDLDSTPCFPYSGGGEQNSVWLQLHVLQAGSIVFKITPVNRDDDYDFAVINATGKGCGGLSLKDIAGCNFNSHAPNDDGVIGLSDTSRKPYILAGTVGYSFAQPVFAKSNDVYLIMINNYGNYVSGAPSKGFSIDFTGSTAVFYDVTSPRISGADVPCTNASSITLKTNTRILCSSIATDGSDFTTNAPVKIISASGLNCNDRGGYTNSITINFASVIPPGSYTISAKRGTDNNSLLGLCNSEVSTFDIIPFIVKQNGKVVMDNEQICFQQLPYSWNGFQLPNGGDSVATYTTKSTEGCDSTTILNLLVEDAPQQIVKSETICDGDSYLLPWDSAVNTAGTYVHHYTNIHGCDSIVESFTVNVFVPNGGTVEARDSTIETGFCQNGFAVLIPEFDYVSYLWNSGETTSSITVNVAGTYALIAKDKFGCTTIDTFVVAAYQYPVAAFKGTETLCSDSTKILDAGAGLNYYLWNTGSNNQTIITDKPGKFWVTLTNTHNCTTTDTVNVVQVQSPQNFLVPDITKCSYKTITVTPAGNFSTYTWSTGSDTKSVDIPSGGLYSLQVIDKNGCTGTDSVNVVDSACVEYFYMPTAFTPNGDGRNDVFKPAFDGPVLGFHFFIYNRWGKLIFSSENPAKGWDGTVQSLQQPMGTYIWICSYQLDGQPAYTQKGTVTLIR